MIRAGIRAVLLGSDLEQALVVALVWSRLPSLVILIAVAALQHAERDGWLD